MRVKATITYDGTNFYGFAKQVNEITIQESIERVLNLILNKETRIYASGRTDKGVHALNQVIDFEIDENININKLKNSLNKLLPNSIYFKNIEIVEDTFSSRFNAISKTYIYIVSKEEKNIFLQNFVYFNNKLDISKMINASNIFIGKHNFMNFTSKDKDDDNFIRTIFSIDVKKSDGYYIFSFCGNGFMKYMVRKIMGTLIEIGLSKIDENFIISNLNSKKREIVNYTALPHALFLKEVKY